MGWKKTSESNNRKTYSLCSENHSRPAQQGGPGGPWPTQLLGQEVFSYVTDSSAGLSTSTALPAYAIARIACAIPAAARVVSSPLVYTGDETYMSSAVYVRVALAPSATSCLDPQNRSSCLEGMAGEPFHPARNLVRRRNLVLGKGLANHSGSSTTRFSTTM